MFCSSCGNAVATDENFCRVCGKQILTPVATTNPPVVMGVPAVPARTSGKAVASLICGILFIFILPAILAIVLGHLALSEIKRSNGRITGNGLAIAGLVLGYFGAIPFALIIAAIAIPNLLRARMAANESSAAALEHTIIVAEVGYLGAYPPYGYATLAQLGGSASPCVPSPAAACLIDNNLATNGEGNGRNGYTLAVTPGGSALTGWHYYATAAPLSNATGTRSFCAVDDGVVRVAPAGTITAATSYEGCLSWTPLSN